MDYNPQEFEVICHFAVLSFQTRRDMIPSLTFWFVKKLLIKDFEKNDIDFIPSIVINDYRNEESNALILDYNNEYEDKNLKKKNYKINPFA